jgi:hypothetical protein
LRSHPRNSSGPAPSWVLLFVAFSASFAGTPLPVHEDAPVVLKTPASKEDRERIRETLTAAERSLPRPSSTFRLAAEGEERGVGKDAGKLDEPSAWNPIRAWISWTYETRAASEEDERSLEVNLALNGEQGLSSGLASVAGDARVVPWKGALAVRQTLIGAEEGSRVAVPMTEEDARRALTLVRVYIVRPELELWLRRTVEETKQLPRLDDTHVVASRPDATAAIIVEIRGEGRDVEALAPKIDASALRKLLVP